MLVVVMFLQGSMQSSPRLERGEEEHEEEVGLKLVALSVEPPSQVILYSTGG